MSIETAIPTDQLIVLLEAAGFVREVKQCGRFIPENGQPYWYTNHGVNEKCWLDTPADKARCAAGQCYRSRDEAVAALDKQLALVRVQDKLDVMTWDKDQLWEIYYDYDAGEFSYSPPNYHKVGALLGSRVACVWVVEKMKDDLKLIAGVS